MPHKPRAWEGVFCGINDYEDCTYSELNGECHQANCPYQTSQKPESRTSKGAGVS